MNQFFQTYQQNSVKKKHQTSCGLNQTHLDHFDDIIKWKQIHF